MQNGTNKHFLVVYDVQKHTFQIIATITSCCTTKGAFFPN